jgi:hypothetical protein
VKAARVVAFVVVAACFCGIGVARRASAEVIGYTAAAAGPDTVLTSVTVTRGPGPAIFNPAKLIGVRLTHFKSADGSNIATPPGAGVPAAHLRGALLSDGKLNSGVINPGGQAKPLASDPVLDGPDATPGMAVEFEQPVVNLPGDDVVFFEFQREESSPLGGDAFHVSPLRFEPGLRSVTVESYDIHFDDPQARSIGQFDFYRLDRAPQSLAELKAARLARIGTPDGFKALAVGIDLSDLGYADGAEVRGLFFQDNDGKGLLVDPVLIAGLPAPEPENLLAEAPKSSEPEPGRLLERFLEGPMAGVDEIVFAVRVCGFDHWYANFGYYSASVPEYPPHDGIPGEKTPPLFGDGGRLCRYNLRTHELRVLLDDATGGVRDPQVHYDAQKILFSYRKGGQPYYHLYEIRCDGSGLVQLTDGPYDDIEPTYLPDGGIMFSSSRAKRFVNCYRTPVATLYRCEADGSNVRPVSTNIEHENTPWPLADGRVLYMRWEYVDRSQFCFHHLWTIDPDGTGQMVYFGNQFPDTAMLDAKPIPGTDKVVASFSPGHGRPGHMGPITVIDPGTGPDNRGAARRVSQAGQLFRDPYPFSEDCFLVADNRGIHVMDGNGNTDLVYKLPRNETRLTCHEPRPLVPRNRERVIPPRIDPAKATGRLVLADVYQGRNMAGVRRGEIKKLLVLEQLPKPISFSGGMWPISVGGTFTLARILGTVPVAPDGSAYMELPARRPLFFVALDENDLSVKRMQSFVSVEPGEVTGCVGCHEQRLTAPLAALRDTAILGRAPSRIEPVADVPPVLDFPRDVQPILDRHCVECHNPDRLEGRADFSGDHSPLFSQSYWTIMHRGLIADGRNENYGDRPPRTIGTSASPLLKYLDGSHYDARLSEHEQRVVRLWIESSAVYAGTYAALGTGMTPVEFPTELMERRCGACHAQEPPAKGRIGTGLYFRFGDAGPYLPLVHEFTDLQQIRGSIGYYKFGSARPPQSLCNLTRPEKSPLLRAPLAVTAGGLGFCEPTVFADTSDADYQAILAPIQAAAERHQQEKRFDMPGFRPNVYYVRVMQHYGVLPADLSPDEPVDYYAADEAYWRSFWYHPNGQSR